MDESNVEFDQALAFVNSTDHHVFLTGKAGTGKTSFLRELSKNTHKKILILAPTGVAATNAGGVTIHSIFPIPREPIVSTNQVLLENIRFTSSNRDLLQSIDLIVFDEASMVRADILDSVDYLFRKVRNSSSPFGGVQVLFIGDMYQLSPIAKRDERQILDREYTSPFLIDAKVFPLLHPVFIELKKIYRQSDETFLKLLEKIRKASCTKDDIDNINRLYSGDQQAEQGWITLVTHTAQAEKINNESLEGLPSELVNFDARITGEFEDNLYPVPKQLQIKIGAQVMLVRNDKEVDKRYFNGKIGKVVHITPDKLTIEFTDKDRIEIAREIWVNSKYEIDELKQIGTSVIGSFEQFPLKLAWAITIHKSQGLTFDRAVIDAGAAFTPGQVYVAFSRLTSLKYVALRSKITEASISLDPVVNRFEDLKAKQINPGLLLQESQNRYLQKILLKIFDWQELGSLVSKAPPLTAPIFAETNLILKEDFRHVVNSQKAVVNLLVEGPGCDFVNLHTWTEKARKYFENKLSSVLLSFKSYIKTNKNDINHKRNIPLAQGIIKTINQLLKSFEFAERLTYLLAENKPLHVALNLINVKTKGNQHSKSGFLDEAQNDATEDTTLKLLRQSKTIAEIAVIRGLTVQTIEYHLGSFIKDGKVTINELIEPDLFENIYSTARNLQDHSLFSLKKHFGKRLSLGQIAALREYLSIN